MTDHAVLDSPRRTAAGNKPTKPENRHFQNGASHRAGATQRGSIEVGLKATRPAILRLRSALPPSPLHPAVLAALLLCAWAGPATSQTIDATTYPFTFGTGAALEDMSSGTTQLLGPDLDNAASAVAQIGFDFWFAGVRQTSFSVNSNGLL